MLIFTSGIFLLVLVEQSTQISFSNAMNSEMPSSSTANGTHQAGCIKTIGPCFQYKPNAMAACTIERTLRNMDCAIASNATWRFNEYISFKKNLDWQPIEPERRDEPELLSAFLHKLLSLFTSRSIQFTLPDNDLTPEGRMKTFGFSNLNAFTDLSGPVGKRQSD